mgnify:CR=1 FL=1
MPTLLPTPLDQLQAIAFVVDGSLTVVEATGGASLVDDLAIVEGSDLGLRHPELTEPLREAIGGHAIRRRVVVDGQPMLLDARPQGAGAVALLLSLDDERPTGVELTARQLEILNLLCLGLTSREIGRRLWIAETTVENHLRGVYRRLGCTTRAEAVSRAFRLGLVDPVVLDAVDRPA